MAVSTQCKRWKTANGTLKRFTGTQFLDSTGDGWLGHMSGREYRYGRESKHEFDEEWEEHGELWSPEKPDNRVMGSSVMWYTRATNKRVNFPAVPWAAACCSQELRGYGRRMAVEDLRQ